MKRLQLKSDNCLSHNHAQAQESKNGSTSKRKFYNQPNYHNPTPSRSKGMTIETLERLARTDFLSPGGNPDEVLQTTFTNFLRRSDIPTARETDLAESDASAKIKIGMRLGTAALALEVVQKTCYMARMKRDRERKMEQLAEKEKERAEKDGKTRFIGRKWKTPTKPRRTDPGEGKAQESAKRAAAVVLEHWESSLIPWIDFLVDEATGLAEGYSDEECPSTCIRVCAHVLFTLLRLLDDELVLEALDRPSTILLVIKIWTYVVPVTASNSGSEGGSVGKDEDEDKRSDGDSDGSSDDDSTLEEQEYIVMLDPCLCNDEDSVQTCPILGLFELCCGHPSRTKLFLSKAWEFMPSFTPYVLVDTLLQRLDVLVEIHSELGNTEPAMLYLEYMASVTHQILYTSDRVAKILYQDQFILRFADTLHSLLQNEGKDACVSTWEVAVHILMDFISWTQDYCIWRIKGRPHYFLDPVRQVQELLDGNLFLVLMRALEHLKPETKYYNMALSGIALVGSYSLYPRVLDVVSIDMDEHMGKDNLDRVFAKSDFAKVVVGSFIRSWLHGVDRQDCEDGSHYRCNNLTASPSRPFLSDRNLYIA
ncbi:hypothetical protein FA15DRAFT_227448 [Coprinopsis marcescibilis]|uniref:Uncharacterized protein n=1 Tax=Coprinopsis marcescibilis TaxID=230819 RepID=A0A5C3L2W3_COPMA|nr:hypothetical protein FA15DRAFT_227448 [Coprinopsis marcescibilis]